MVQSTGPEESNGLHRPETLQNHQNDPPLSSCPEQIAICGMGNNSTYELPIKYLLKLYCF